MKKIILVGAVALLGLASCKKDYTCECTTTSDFMGQKSTATVSATINDTKSKATDACEAGSMTSGTTSVSCKIK